MSQALYVGGDESNHGGQNRKEIIVATFSSLRADSIVEKFPGRREAKVLDGWLGQPEVDYRFALVPHERAKSPLTLSRVLPFLVESYMNGDTDMGLDELKLYLDGQLSSGSKRILREREWPREIGQVVVDNFVKRRKNRRAREGQRCPRLVYVADALASRLLHNFSRLDRDPKIVSLPEDWDA